MFYIHGELEVVEDIAAFASNAFLPVDTEEVAAKLQKASPLPGAVDMEMGDMHNVSQAKGRWLLGTCQQKGASSPQLMATKSECLLRINLPLWNAIFTDENQQIKVQEAADSQTAPDCLLALMSQTTRHSQTVFCHSHHADLSHMTSDGVVVGHRDELYLVSLTKNSVSVVL